MGFIINWLSSSPLQNQNTHSKNHFLWLAVHEDGVSFLEQSTMVCLHSYCYSEVATFGEHGDDFMLVVSPRRSSTSRQKPSHATTVQAEKILLSMSKLKVSGLCVYDLSGNTGAVEAN